MHLSIGEEKKSPLCLTLHGQEIKFIINETSATTMLLVVGESGFHRKIAMPWLW
jgi:hypothetical protein